MSVDTRGQSCNLHNRLPVQVVHRQSTGSHFFLYISHLGLTTHSRGRLSRLSLAKNALVQNIPQCGLLAGVDKRVRKKLNFALCFPNDDCHSESISVEMSGQFLFAVMADG